MKSTILKLSLLTLALGSFSQITAQEKPKQDPEKIFKRMDTNKDKLVTFDEFKNMKRKNEIPMDKLQKRFNKMDADSNGSLTFDEMNSNMKDADKKNEKENKKQ